MNILKALAALRAAVALARDVERLIHASQARDPPASRPGPQTRNGPPPVPGTRARRPTERVRCKRCNRTAARHCTACMTALCRGCTCPTCAEMVAMLKQPFDGREARNPNVGMK